jgi:predicted glycosyltransferase involved in capsule biosynthesis
MKERFREEISSGLIRYGKVRNLPLFKMAYSKNLSHTLSAGDFIFNTDADCLLTDEYPVKLYESVLEMDLNRIAVRDDCRVQGWLGLSKKNFTAMNGYDEGFEVWGSDDVDLYSRLRLKADVKNFD